MKRLLACGLVALALGGCANKSVQLNNSVTLNTMEGVVSLYGTVLSAERAYKSLPLCKTGTKFTVAAPCAQRSIVQRLMTADAAAVSAVTRANTFIQAYPTVDASNLISAAASAVSNIQAILNTTGAN